MDLKGKPIEMESLIEYQEGSVVSMEVIKKELGTVTVFAFDKGQGLSEHSAPFDAMVQIITQSRKGNSSLCLQMFHMHCKQ